MFYAVTFSYSLAALQVFEFILSNQCVSCIIPCMSIHSCVWRQIMLLSNTIFKFEKLNDTMLKGISKILTMLSYTLQFSVCAEKSFKHFDHMGYKKVLSTLHIV